MGQRCGPSTGCGRILRGSAADFDRVCDGVCDWPVDGVPSVQRDGNGTRTRAKQLGDSCPPCFAHANANAIVDSAPDGYTHGKSDRDTNGSPDSLGYADSAPNTDGHVHQSRASVPVVETGRARENRTGENI